MKQVQISEELFSRLYNYHILNKRDLLQEEIIRNQLEDKMSRIQARINYKNKNGCESHP